MHWIFSCIMTGESAKSARNIKVLIIYWRNYQDVFVIFRWSFTLSIFETIAETTQEILENWTFCYQLYTVQITDNQTIERYNFWQYNTT